MADGAWSTGARRRGLRLHLSLRWKAFGVLVLLLGAVHVFFGAFMVRQSLQYFRQTEKEQLLGARRTFDGLQQQSVDNLVRIANQIAASASFAETAGPPLDQRLSPDLLADLSTLRVFDAQGRPLQAFRLADSTEPPAPVRDALLDSVRRTHRPASAMWCQEQCALLVYMPAFDRDGREALVGLGQPAADLLLAFSRQTGIDAALLSGPASAGPGTLLGKKLFAISNAPTLLPRLKNAAAGVAAAPLEQPFAARTDGVSLMLLLERLPADPANPIQVLFVADESLPLQHINASLHRGVLVSLALMLLSSAALWIFVSRQSRRLRLVSQTLPMLAEKRFAEARGVLEHAERRAPRLSDEIDLLTRNARWLASRLERLDTAEAASAAKSRFLATMSHEVRTPLNGILGLIELLQHSELRPGQRDSIRMVHDSAQSLLRVLDDTLDLARIEAGRIDLALAPFPIEQVVAGCAETAASRARAKGLKLVAYVDPTLPPQLVGDAMRLRQVLGNLCSNAVKFTERGRVVIRAEHVGTVESQVRVRFSVLDTGVGISAEVQQTLFQPFQQGGGQTTARYGGSGLGLSICDGLVRRMGGRIGLVSAPGEGSEFSFWLQFPVAAPAPGAELPDLAGVEVEVAIAELDERAWICAYLRSGGALIRSPAALRLGEDAAGLVLWSGSSRVAALPHPVHRAGLLQTVAEAAGRIAARGPRAPAPAPAPARRLRVLAVDDHPTNRELIHQQLRLLGHEADTAADGAAALALLRERHYDLLLTDLRMPVLDGIGLVGEIRKLEAAGALAGRLPAIALSAHAWPCESDCHEAGFDECLVKPLSLDQLRRALARLDGEAEQTQQALAAGPAPAAPPVIDLAALTERLGGDEALARRMLREFLRINAPLLAGLADPARQHDCAAVSELAHRLLGSARTASAEALAQALAALEGAASRRRAEQITPLVEAVEGEFERLRRQADALSA